MVVSFSLGNKSKQVINTLKKTADNVTFYSYKSVQELIKEAKLRHIDFKRIIFSTEILSDVEKDLTDLNNFIKEYSASTEIVMIMLNAESGQDKIFNSIFNSPMYTPVILGKKSNPKVLLEMVMLDVLELKARYYILDKKPDVKNATENTDSTLKEEQVFEPTPNIAEIESNTSSSFMAGPTALSMEEVGSSSPNAFSSETVNTENTLSYENGSVSVGANSDVVEKIEEDDDLAIGDFGMSHSDTGFLDEEEEDLKEYLQSQQNQPLENQSQQVEKRNYYQKKEPRKLEDRKMPNIDLVVALRGSGATQSIVDEAVQIYNKDKAKVLIIDLDNSENGILSYIDTGRFYRESAYEGIVKQRVYSEDNIDIVSNGYGLKVTTRDLKALLKGNLLLDYDMVFIDCPMDSLNVIDNELIDMMHVLIISGSDRTQLIATSIALSDRRNTSLYTERSIIDKCMVELEGEVSDTDIQFVQDTCLFANGCWLRRL